MIFLCCLYSLGNITPKSNDWLGQPKIDDILKYKKLSIVFAGENLNAPASLFGHTFLVAHNNALPEPDAITIEYLALSDVKNFSYLKAAFYIVPGKITFSRFQHKVKTYDLENRDLWIYEIDKSKLNLKSFVAKIDNLSREESNYNFFTHNCSYYITAVLTKDLGLEPYTIPIETIKRLRRLSLIKSAIYKPSSLRVLENNMAKLSKNDQRIVHNALNGYSIGMENSNNKILANTIGLAINFRMPREPLEFNQINLMNQKKKFPVQDIKSINKDDPSISRTTKSLMISYTNYGMANIVFRPAYMGFENKLSDERNLTSLELLKTSLVFSQESLYLQEFNLFRMRALMPAGHFYSGFNRDFEISYYDWSIENDALNEVVSRFGIGYSLSFFKNIGLIGIIPSVGMRMYDINGENRFAGSVMGKLYLQINFSSIIRTIATYQYEAIDVLGFTRYMEVETYLLETNHFSIFTIVSIMDFDTSLLTFKGGIRISF